MATTAQGRHRIPTLTPPAELALLARSLYTEGYDDHNLGHITYRQPDDTLLSLPDHLGWNEACASDVIRLDLSGTVIEGDGEVTPAIELHLALHRARSGAVVAIHHHPRYGTVYAAARRIPPAFDQVSAFFRESDIALYTDFDGAVKVRENAESNVRALGERNVALLANHGVFVIGDDIRQAHFRAVTLEWRCRQAWLVESVGGGVPVPANGQAALVELIGELQDRPPHLWEWAVRREIRSDPWCLK